EAPRALVVDALGHGMRPGDVYYACALARASGRACRGLVEAWREDPGGGWPGVAERLGLALDDLHRRVRDGIRASYRRWARPDGHLAPRRGRCRAALLAALTPARPKIAAIRKAGHRHDRRGYRGWGTRGTHRGA